MWAHQLLKAVHISCVFNFATMVLLVSRGIFSGLSEWQAFQTGMGCIDTYSQECLSDKDRKIFESHIAGARHTFHFLCNDPGFREEYLMYTTCYKGISKDWDACANKFIALAEEEISRKNSTDQSRLVELCCAKHGFLKCVYYASWLKCRKEEAIFIRKIADTLASIRVYTPRCKSINVAICSGSSRPVVFWYSSFLSPLLAVYMSV
ncbi:uncharacterized protein [Halyomorpha halys]|uniref:uncharacterized protein isoform X2 n=1 Tax=Halyomorpha halys TaxID=286706 RepID=UPI0034D1DAAF